MSTRKHIRKRMIAALSVFVAFTAAGCQESEQTAGHIGQANVMEEMEDYASEQELVLQSGESITTDSKVQAQIDAEHEVSNVAGVMTDEVNEIDAVSTGIGQLTGQSEDKQERPQPPEGWELVFASEDWGLSFGESGTQPTGNASAEDLAWYDAYYVGDDSEKVIYLTFDCGYENGNTEPILDALKKHDVQATFFVVGHFLETAPDMATRMVEEGHAVGNHTYHHLDMPTISDQDTFQREMDDVANLFHEITGTELSRYYRPPQGKCNTQNLKMAQELGYNTIFWSLAYVDWNQDDQPSHKEAFEKLTTRIHPGAIVLLHNTSQTNGEILDELLSKWEEMGYSFRPLSELVNQ